MSKKNSITGRYSLYTNQRRGYMDIRKTGTTIQGTMIWFLTKKMVEESTGNMVYKKVIKESTFEGKVFEWKTTKRNTIEVNFTRNNNPQVYTGFFSDDLNIISGWFQRKNKEDGKLVYKKPWYATRINDEEI